MNSRIAMLASIVGAASLIPSHASPAMDNLKQKSRREFRRAQKARDQRRRDHADENFIRAVRQAG